MDKYSSADKLLHYVAFKCNFLNQFLFEIDCLLNNRKVSAKSPVYITGLARSGTTILLEALGSTDKFASLTYRDMPFVTAPILWSKVASKFTQQGALEERAHKDGIKVSYDSKEAFEEVFIKAISDKKYILEDRLEAHLLSDANIELYKDYINNILAAKDGVRYLAKNNNNTLRVSSIKKAFPDAVILVPFRNPVDHANSLLRQNELFNKSQQDDGFVKDYMEFLGHFEFGNSFKYFNLGEEMKPLNNDALNSVDYWLKYWKGVYSYLLEQHKDDVVFFSHDVMCSNPKEYFQKLACKIGLDDEKLVKFAGSINSKPLINIEDVPEEYRGVYERLLEASL